MKHIGLYRQFFDNFLVWFLCTLIFGWYYILVMDSFSTIWLTQLEVCNFQNLKSSFWHMFESIVTMTVTVFEWRWCSVKSLMEHISLNIDSRIKCNKWKCLPWRALQKRFRITHFTVTERSLKGHCLKIVKSVYA